MKIEDFVIVMKYLGTAYGKEFDKEQITLWYSLLKEYNISDFKNAIKELILTNKFLPSIADVKAKIDNMKVENTQNKFKIILDKMYNDGYFKNASEYEKIITWYEKDIIPQWFKEDMKKYGYNEENNNLIENTNQLKIA